MSWNTVVYPVGIYLLLSQLNACATVISNFFDTSDRLLDYQLLKYRYTAHHCEVPVQPLYIATGMTGSSADEIHFTVKSVL